MTWRVIVGTLSLVITMIVVGYVAVTEQDRMANFAIAYDAREVEVGAALFESNCATCHGLRGQGVPAKGPALNTPELFDGTRLQEAAFAGTVDNFVRATIAGGRPRMSDWARAQNFLEPMPTWSQTYGGPLRPDQVESVVAFVMNWGLAFVEDGAGGVPTPAVEGVGTDITVELPAGDAEAGRAVAEAQACTACHVTTTTGPAWQAAGDPNGQGIGTRAELRLEQPDYTGSATDGDQYLFESIVAPDAYIVPGNPAYAPTGSSIMPHDLGAKLDAQMMADLIAYLQSIE
jgi:mono/diheme cytochrome c family protein